MKRRFHYFGKLRFGFELPIVFLLPYLQQFFSFLSEILLFRFKEISIFIIQLLIMINMFCYSKTRYHIESLLNQRLYKNKMESMLQINNSFCPCFFVVDNEYLLYPDFFFSRCENHDNKGCIHCYP